MASLRSFLAFFSKLPQKTLIAFIFIYRCAISPVIGPRCRFHPTCSEYALQTLKEHSFMFALWIIIKRLLKCHPFHPGGVDPVPTRRKHQ